MASVLSTRQCAIAAMVVVLVLLAGLPSPLNPARAQSAPAISLDPTEGPPGTAVTVQGSGWVPGDTVILWFAVNLEADGSSTENTSWYDIGQATVGDDGTFVSTFTVPAEATDSGAQGVSVDTYEASHQAVTFFHVVTEAEETPPPEDEPTLNPAVAQLRLYESGYGELPPEQRVYAEHFASETSRYINWELDLEYAAPGSPVDFKITAIYLRDTGTASWEEINRYTIDAHVEGDQTGSSHWSGYGCDDPPNCWAIGLYRVDIYFEGLGTDGQLMASQGFEVSGEAETNLVANAGPDQTVPGPSPVAVQFDGSGSTGDIVSYQWYNQYGLLLAEEVTPVIEVNFGKDNPQPGTQRTFTLVVADSQGNTAEDQVTITLGETPEEEKTPPPEVASTITLNPTEGLPGTEVTATGSGWIAGETVIIQFAISRHGDNLEFSEVAQATVDEAGNFEITFTIPANAALGDQKVIAGTAAVSQQTDAVFRVTGEPVVTVDQALTLGPDNPEWTSGHEKTIFRPGDTIWYAVVVRNSGPPVNIDFTWRGKHADPQIDQEIFFDKNTVTVPKGDVYYYSPDTIPSDAAAGPYLNIVTVTIGGQEFVRESRFEVVRQEAPTPTPTATPTPPEPGRLRVITALSMPTTSLFVGESITVSFTVKNVGGSAIHLEKLTAAVRRGSDWNGAQADFPHVLDITLQPNEEYVYQQSRNFETAGDYFAEPVVKMNGQWGSIANANRVSFTVQKGQAIPTHVFLRPKGRADNLIVLVHGCCTDANGVRKDWYNLGILISEAIARNQTSEEWEIVVWDWHKNEETGVVQTPWLEDFKPWELRDFTHVADIAYTYADVEGLELADAINQYSKYKHVHLIAHSAGAKLIDKTAKQLAWMKERKNREKPFIHLTFLDAYTPLNKGERGRYGSLPDNYPHYSEHYVDKGLLFTDAILQNAFNFEITFWTGAGLNWLVDKPVKGWPLGHWWPVTWYINSITAPELNHGLSGFPLSLEGGNNQLNDLDQIYHPGEKCYLNDIDDIGDLLPPARSC
jgi:hypothetical protein